MAPDPFDHESIELQARHGDIFGQYDDRFGRRSSRRARHTNAGPAPYEDIPEVKDIDFRKAQKFRGWSVLPLAYQATGVAHGQISISLLYVYSSTFSHDPSAEDVKGALSLIIWSLILVVTIKYSLIILYADDEGEGAACSAQFKPPDQVEQQVDARQVAPLPFSRSYHGIATWPAKIPSEVDPSKWNVVHQKI